MGDMMTLIEEATANISEDDALNLMEKMLSGKYDYNDLLKQFKMIKGWVHYQRILGFLPGMKNLKQQISNVDDKNYLELKL